MFLTRFLIFMAVVSITYVIVKLLFRKSTIESLREKVEQDVILAKEVDELDKLASTVNIKKTNSKLKKLTKR